MKYNFDEIALRDMKIYINEKPHDLRSGRFLENLLKEIGMDSRTGIAVAVNNSVIPKMDWAAMELKNDDKIMIIHATQGG